jgi:HEPN domain-containing protein
MKNKKASIISAEDIVPCIEAVELKTITELILSKVRAEKIICFGSIINNVKNSSCFLQDERFVTSKENSYYLLVVPTPGEQIPDIVLQQQLEEGIKAFGNATIIVHRMKEINTALQNGGSFFTNIYKRGLLLHDNEKELFSVPVAGADTSKRITKRENFWNQWHLLSENFLKGAHFYYEKHFNNLAVFMLHQSLQHCYTGMLRVLTGYRSSSNSLRRSLKMIDNILPEASFSSSKHTPENARLLGLLMKGFSDARYSEKFDITSAELSTLMNRIENIVKQANITCMDHLNKLKEGKTSYTIA